MSKRLIPSSLHQSVLHKLFLGVLFHLKQGVGHLRLVALNGCVDERIVDGEHKLYERCVASVEDVFKR